VYIAPVCAATGVVLFPLTELCMIGAGWYAKCTEHYKQIYSEINTIPCQFFWEQVSLNLLVSRSANNFAKRTGGIPKLGSNFITVRSYMHSGVQCYQSLVMVGLIWSSFCA